MSTDPNQPTGTSEVTSNPTSDQPAGTSEVTLEPRPPTPPPAATTVLEGTKTERELALERDIKERETRIAELEDENRQLKTPPTPRPAPKPAKKARATFFD